MVVARILGAIVIVKLYPWTTLSCATQRPADVIIILADVLVPNRHQFICSRQAKSSVMKKYHSGKCIILHSIAIALPLKKECSRKVEDVSNQMLCHPGQKDIFTVSVVCTAVCPPNVSACSVTTILTFYQPQ